MYLRDAVLHDDLADIPRLGGYFAYRGGQGVWDFVAEEYGREKVSEILERVRLTRSVPAAFRDATGLTLMELSDRWKEALKAVYFPEVAAREDLDVVGRVLVDERDGAYHTSPAISPYGDRVAYVSTKDGLFDVYVVSTSGTEPPVKLIDGQDNTAFESLRILSPGLGWSPDGQRLAVAVKSGPSEAVAVVDVATGRTQHYRVPEVDAVLAVAWHPGGEQIAFSGTAGAHSDLYRLDLATGAVENLTDDLFADLDPAWSPDGRSLVFHSDRAGRLDTGVAAARATGPDGFDLVAHDYSQYDVYRLHLDRPGRLERLTDDETWDDTGAEFADSLRVVFVSDRNGVWNLYEKDLATGEERPLTDLQTGVIQLSLSADGRRAAVSALHEGTPSIYVLRDPLGRTDEVPAPLAPNVWAQRVMGEAEPPAPPLQVASEATRRRNPFLRDAADGVPFAADPLRRSPRPEAPDLAALAASDSLLQRLLGAPPDSLAAPGGTNGGTNRTAVVYEGLPSDLLASADTAAVDFRDYAFSEAFEEAARERFEALQDRFSPPENTNDDGSFRVRRYRLRFSPDLVYAAGGYDTVFGVQSVTTMLFSDMLGDHRLALATNLVLDLRNSDYLLSYQYLGRRTDYTFEGFHLARELGSLSANTVFRYRNYGLVAGASYPLDKFRRVDASLSLLGVSLSDLSDLGAQPRTREFVYPRVAFTSDHTVPGYLSPASGRRWAVSVAGSPGPDVNFVTALADARQYVNLGYGYTIALRGSGGASVGPDPQKFYAAGVQNWINASYQALPIEDPDDFVFATPVLPLRGYRFNEAVGDRFALLNAEFRAPLIAALLPGPIPILPLYNLQAVGFVDAGVLAEDGFDLWRVNAEGKRVYDDVFAGVGAGLRTILLGYPVRVDWAWPYDGRELGEAQFYLSVGLDF